MTKVYSKAMASIESTDDDEFGPNGGFIAVLSTPSLDRDNERLLRDEWKDFTQERYPLDIDHGMSVADTVGSFVPYWDETGERMMMKAHFADNEKIPNAKLARSLTTPDPITGIRHVQNVSVAFMIDKTQKDTTTPFRELLNAGIVATPSNRDAVILASKAASALKDAFSDTTEGEVPEEVKTAVLETLMGQKEAPEEKPGVHLNVHARLNEESAKHVQEQLQSMLDAFSKGLQDAVTKAAATASGVGGDGALVQAIHDASSHLGAACPVIEVSDEDTGASSGANKSVEAFEKALDEILKPESSGSPEAPAPVDETPAPASPDADAEVRARAMRMGLALLTPIETERNN